MFTRPIARINQVVENFIGFVATTETKRLIGVQPEQLLMEYISKSGKVHITIFDQVRLTCKITNMPKLA